jgi:tetratricopeptide (TPR) repeat protein
MNVANALEAEFSLTEQDRIEKVLTDSPEAYRAYLRGRTFHQAFNWQPAAVALQQAIEIEPDFAAAHAELAWVYSSMLVLPVQLSAPRDELASLGRTHAERAIELDPDIGVAYAALGALDRLAGNWDKAEQELDRARELSPRDVNVLGTLSRYYADQGNFAEAVRVREPVVQVDPLNPTAHLSMGVMYALAGDFENSLKHYRRFAELSPSVGAANAQLGRSEIIAGNREEGLRYLRIAEQFPLTPGTLSVLVVGYALAGEMDDALRNMEQFEAFAKENPVGDGIWTLVYAALGEREKAMDHLERAIDNPVPGGDWLPLLNVKTNSNRIPMLDEPEFVEARNRLQSRR